MQRVSEASVEVDGAIVGEIGRGLMVLVGCAKGDGDEDVRFIADKISNLRVFEDDDGKMNRAVSEIDGEVLLVPNFTLCGDCRKGRRPSFTGACAPEKAKVLMNDLAAYIAGTGLTVAQGSFGAMMEVSLTNSGPVTLLLDSDRSF